ncbi:LLM class flavin-dependent oxidoreductase [Leisingera thetidis]|uniref:LLM class flavin-dependent oxidoreductase n=1 Tax=Leisingera thetidis TaxID=2930199 RepID=UPI0021F7746D|nr:LLM class flavin-dependent oxidoreductase [Leisingera thetidis]
MRFYTTCPASSAYSPGTYAARVRQIAQWSEAAGAEGALIYTDNGLADPWAIAQMMLAETGNFIPMIAVQPVYMPPYAVAKRIATLAMLTGRKVALNMVAGGFPRDLQALGDRTAHDDRYARLEEYCQIFQSLLRGETVSLKSKHFEVDGLRLLPELAQTLLPEVFLSSSSPAGRAAAGALAATPVSYPAPPGERPEDPAEHPAAVVRIGILARDTAAEAWALAEARFPEDPRGSMMHRMAMATSDSAWHRQLSEMAAGGCAARGIYWLRPFKTYKTFCPYLVGSFDQVAAALRGYAAQGVTGLILDVPATEDDLRCTAHVISLAGTSAPEPLVI